MIPIVYSQKKKPQQKSDEAVICKGNLLSKGLLCLANTHISSLFLILGTRLTYQSMALAVTNRYMDSEKLRDFLLI